MNESKIRHGRQAESSGGLGFRDEPDVSHGAYLREPLAGLGCYIIYVVAALTKHIQVA